ncbi:nitroreductase/quinone reductase family protein [Rhodococcus sp. JS3073]|uniref:nitroreductase/quinone reductase family protein n=1 Tax=Rhodococcus sp. JS3073 TaxID=3002901 RepID=UPI002285CD8B|nr:nitroreductase/quinone reductase family protein [Rhodococcus sp. JS3073]WAM19026.1 nitroreductase/quinone reductase family protein [Rhodococcus sp. JS3073]
MWARVFATGRTPWPVATLEVIGRKSGKPVRLPIIIADLEGERYLVSVLGEDTNWVRNVRAAEHRAVLLQRDRTAVRLDEVPVAHRAPIIKRYCKVATSGRAHPGRPQRPNRSVRGHRHRLPGVPHRPPRPELRRGREQILRGQHGHSATIACPQVDPDRTPPRRGNAASRMHGHPDVRRSPAQQHRSTLLVPHFRSGGGRAAAEGAQRPRRWPLARRCRASELSPSASTRREGYRKGLHPRPTLTRLLSHCAFRRL